MLAGPKSMWWLVWPAIMYQKPAQLSWARVLVVQGCLYKPIRMLQNTATNLAGPLEGESKKIFVSPLHWNSFVSATRESHPYFWELCLKEKKKIEGNLQTWSKTVSLPYFRSEPKWKSIRKHLFPLWKSQIMLIIPSKYLPFLSDFHSVFHLPSRSLCLSLSPCDFNEMDEVSFVCVFKKDKEKRTLLWWQDHRQMSGKVACRWE